MLLNGEGRPDITATSTTQLITFDKSGANSLSVDVEGTDSVYVLANISIADFDTAYAAGKAIKVRSGIPFGFYGDQYNNLKSVCFRTASTSSVVNFGAY